MRCIILIMSLTSLQIAWAQDTKQWQGKFEQLDQALPTPNEYRTGSGSPGPKYWQQKADYVINAALNDDNQTITGSETITYHNNSPDHLNYLWLQVDQNIFAKGNNTTKTANTSVKDSSTVKAAAATFDLYDFDGGFKIKYVKDAMGKDLSYIVNQTMMRIDLPTPLKSGDKINFSVDWYFNVLDRSTAGGRSGYEYFPEDDNYLYTIAQWFPRMCVYDDYEGWQNKQFLGHGEFALAFGDYKVRITVPADHIIASTGMLQNPQVVLTKTEQDRFNKAKTSFDQPTIIVTQAEATLKEKTKQKEKKTWVFHAENVRDFAFATSRKFIWDAQAVKIGNKAPLAMSFYPKEGNPLWERESTKAVRNTLITYSKYTIDYPYPVAISVHTADIGMEYPMICFNWGRPNKDGTYNDAIRNKTVFVIIHEVGHNFFPMIINSDERQWTWQDEGINSFIQYRTEAECYPGFPSKRGPADKLVPYMKGDKNMQRPLMTNSEQVVQFGAEQYTKAATALNVLRETVMGPELFDKAFKEYANRWAFKHPKPADFFRTMEDASAVDLDWFWKGWFYTTDHCDQAIDNVKWFKLRDEKADPERKRLKLNEGAADVTASARNFDNGPQPLTLIETDARMYGEFLNRINDKGIIQKLEGKNIYEITLSNSGGLMMPVIIQWIYQDGTKEIERIPAEIWRNNEKKITKVFVKDKEVINIVLDPNLETSDVSIENNVFPKVQQPSKFDTFKNKTN